MLSIGLMSGTSMDGIDAALIETDGKQLIKEFAHVSLSYDPNFKILLKAAEYAVHKHKGDLEKAKKNYPEAIKEYLTKQLNMKKINISEKMKGLATYITFDDVAKHSTELHREAVKQLLEESLLAANQIDVVGYSGQTLFHDPIHKITVQIGDGQMLADELGITVVNDFRSNDVANGGQGAPFAPIYHQALAIRSKTLPVAIVNCGGVANVTFIFGSNAEEMIGFDTGPGNGLLDSLVKQHTSGKEVMDKDGQYGKQGKVNEKVLQELCEQAIIKNGKNYLTLSPPKSLDINDFKLTKSVAELSLEDGCATLAAFTAETIVKSIKFARSMPQTWILVGGGWNNPVILQELKQRLTKEIKAVKILTAADMGWNNQAIEAQIFAYLAIRSLQGEPLSYPNTTGVSKPLSGGHAHLAKNYSARPAVKKLLEKNPAVLNGYQTIVQQPEKIF